MIEGILYKKFIYAIALLIRIRNLVNDKFFRRRLTEKIFDFGSDFLSFLAVGSEDYVAQYKLGERCLSHIAILIDLLKEFNYLVLIKNRPLLLKTELSLLTIKLNIMRKIRDVRINKTKNIESVNHEIKEDKKQTIKTKPKTKNILTESKKKILEFIKLYPNSRTKDIIYEFNTLSGRTVKRNLSDLLNSGFVRKRIDNKAVYYYSSE